MSQNWDPKRALFRGVLSHLARETQTHVLRHGGLDSTSLSLLVDQAMRELEAPLANWTLNALAESRSVEQRTLDSDREVGTGDPEDHEVDPTALIAVHSSATRGVDIDVIDHSPSTDRIVLDEPDRT